MIVCIAILGLVARLWVTYCEGMLKNGSGFALAMGLDGAGWRSGSDWYGFASESEAVWHSDGVGDH